jgi:hypothetical protein
MGFRSALLAMVLLLAACTAPSAPLEGAGLTGTFHGSPTLEGGCAWLDSGGRRYQLVLPQGYHVDYERLTIVGPDGKTVAKAGDTVTVTGREAAEQLSFCQVGSIFDVETISAGS